MIKFLLTYLLTFLIIAFVVSGMVIVVGIAAFNRAGTLPDLVFGLTLGMLSRGAAGVLLDRGFLYL